MMLKLGEKPVLDGEKKHSNTIKPFTETSLK